MYLSNSYEREKRGILIWCKFFDWLSLCFVSSSHILLSSLFLIISFLIDLLTWHLNLKIGVKTFTDDEKSIYIFFNNYPFSHQLSWCHCGWMKTLDLSAMSALVHLSKFWWSMLKPKLNQWPPRWKWSSALNFWQTCGWRHVFYENDLLYDLNSTSKVTPNWLIKSVDDQLTYREEETFSQSRAARTSRRHSRPSCYYKHHNYNCDV